MEKRYMVIEVHNTDCGYEYLQEFATLEQAQAFVKAEAKNYPGSTLDIQVR
jgi:hypothetical protein